MLKNINGTLLCKKVYFGYFGVDLSNPDKLLCLSCAKWFMKDNKAFKLPISMYGNCYFCSIDVFECNSKYKKVPPE